MFNFGIVAADEMFVHFGCGCRYAQDLGHISRLTHTHEELFQLRWGELMAQFPTALRLPYGIGDGGPGLLATMRQMGSPIARLLMKKETA